MCVVYVMYVLVCVCMCMCVLGVLWVGLSYYRCVYGCVFVWCVMCVGVCQCGGTVEVDSGV